MARTPSARFLQFSAIALCLGLALHGPFAAASWNPFAKSSAPSKPGNLGADVKIEFKGAHAFSERKLRNAIDEQIQQIRRDGLTRPNADDSAYYLSAFYQDNGYATVEVNWEIQGKTLHLDIKEGSPYHLRSLQVTGNESLPTADILAVLHSPTAERFEIPEAKFPYVLDDLIRGSSRLIDWYQAEGFLNADVVYPEIKFSPDSKEVDVLIRIQEGKRYYFGDIQLQGDIAYPSAQILHEIEGLTKLPYTAPRVATIQSTLLQFYNGRAHYDAAVEAFADPASARADGRIPLILQIKAGPAYLFQGVVVQGLSHMSPNWMHNRLRSLEGKPYTPDALEAKRQRLLSSGLFDSLQIEPVPQGNHTLRLEVTAKEAKARELGFSGGYGSYEGAMLGIRGSNRNLFGRGVQGGLELAVSQRTLSIELSVADPWLFETQTEFISRLFLRSRLELGYDKREGGVRGELSRKLLPHLQVAAYGQTKSVEITSAEIQQKDLGKTAYQIGTVGLSATYDRRDEPLNPTRGWIAAGVIDSNSLENGDSFLRTSGRLGWHYPLPWGIGFASSARVGLLSQQNAVPIDERYFLGGATTVRSFRERGLGPHDSQNHPTGGGAYTLANAETDFPLWQNLRGALFFDAGSLSSGGERIPVSNFRTALGVGLRYALPVGPLRFDVGFNPDRKPNESWGAAHISFGFAF